MSRVIAAFAQFFDGAGDPLENGWLKFLYSGTNNTLKNTYADEELTVPNANPVQLDAQGRCPNVFGLGQYKVILYQNNPVISGPGTQIAEFDPVNAENTSASSGTNFESWEATLEYSVSDIVTYNGFYYRSLINSNTGNAPDTNLDKWEKIDFLRYWNINVTYALNDVVVSGNALYFSLADANVGNNPVSSPSWWTPVGTGTILINWEESGTTFRPKLSGYDIGAIGNEVGDMYFQQEAIIWLADNAYITTSSGNNANFRTGMTTQMFLGVSATIDTGTPKNNAVTISVANAAGDANLGTWSFANITGAFWNAYGFDIGKSTDPIGDIYQQENKYHYFGANANIRINTGSPAFELRTTNTDDIRLISSGGAVMLRSGGLQGWMVDATELLPETNGYTIGSLTNLVGDIYQAATATHYIGNTSIWASGDILQLEAPSSIYIAPSDDVQWIYGANGWFYPGSLNLDPNIGRADRPISDIYIAADAKHYFGSCAIWESSTNDNLYINTTTGNSIYFAQNGVTQWSISSAGDLLPVSSVGIGSSTYPLGDVHIAIAANLYFGTYFEMYTSAGGDTLYLRPTDDRLSNLYIGHPDNELDLIRTYIYDYYRIYVAEVLELTVDSTGLTVASDVFLSGDQYIYFGGGGNYIGTSASDNLQIRAEAEQTVYMGHVASVASVTAASTLISFAMTDATGQNISTAWRIENITGHLIPGTAGSMNIGSTDYEIGYIYLGDNKRIYFGNSQDAYIDWDGEMRVSSTGHLETFCASGHYHRTFVNNVEIARLSSTYFRPVTDSAIALGGSAQCWTNIYADAGVTSCSDRKWKQNVKASPLGLDFINTLDAIEWKFKGGKGVKHKRKFHGMLAQDVLIALEDAGFKYEDFAGIQINDEIDEKTGKKLGENMHLRYEQFIAPLINAVQELSDKVKLLEAA